MPSTTSRTSLYFEHDVDQSILTGVIAIIGYGNQGRAQALNLRDSGLEVIIGNLKDSYWDKAVNDGFEVMEISEAVEKASFIMILIPDEIQQEVYQNAIVPNLSEGAVLCFASGYNITFGFIKPPETVDTILVAPRMIGAGVRESYTKKQGFYSFIAVEQDFSGKAKQYALAIASAIGSTKPGGAAVEVTFRQETELDLFNEQCFGPAFGQVLISALEVAVESGYPPEAVFIEIFMSGEFSYHIKKMTEVGLFDQTRLHSTCSQYGSMSRGLRYVNPDLKEQMKKTLGEIQDGSFAEEFQEEWENNLETLDGMREMAQDMEILVTEKEVRKNLGFED